MTRTLASNLVSRGTSSKAQLSNSSINSGIVLFIFF
jgi:hypothetical protein